MWGRVIRSQASIKTRLLIAVGLLALAALVIGATSWHWLSRSNEILKELHGTTIQQVNRSHELTKQSSIFTASAPFLLNLKSPYLVESEGSKLLDSIDSAIASWQNESPILAGGIAQQESILKQLLKMRQQILSLMSEVRQISEYEDRSRIFTQQLAAIEKELQLKLDQAPISEQRDAVRQAQHASHLLITATHETSFLSLGEYRRRFLSNYSQYQSRKKSEFIDSLFSDMRSIALGDEAMFGTRNKILQHNVSARRALNDISGSANTLNVLLLDLIKQSETEIAHQREKTSQNIENALFIVAIFGMGSVVMALLCGFYISGYVVKNLNSITTAMTALASGELDYEEPNNTYRMDELGNLREAFKVFRSNALKLSRLNEQLAHKSALFESTFNNINDGIAITSPKGRVLACNPKLNQLLGYFNIASEVSIGSQLERLLSDIVMPAQIKGVNHLIDDHRELRNQLGQIVEIRTSQLPDGGCVWLFSDTTQRRRVEERLSHFQRLESLGQLTGEVAHDFNNVLSAIKTALQLVESNRTDPEGHTSATNRIEDAVDLGGSLTHRLLAFAKKQRLEPKTVELNELVSGVSELIALSLGDRIDLLVKPAVKPVHVFIDPLQLESALLNLCMNSANAIDGNGVIEIVITRENYNSASITVVDQGCGMSNEVLHRAIEPFYSTRRGGNGSGLGLSIVYGFLKQSGGDLQIVTELGVGTSVTVSLNTVNPLEVIRTNADVRVEPLNGTILVVEDDAATLQYAGNTLREIGQHPIEVKDYQSAKTYLERGLSFTTLFTDLHLGGEKTGWDLARHCIECNAASNIIVTSGKSNELDSPPEDLIDNVVLLAKPYKPKDLKKIIYNTNLL